MAMDHQHEHYQHFPPPQPQRSDQLFPTGVWYPIINPIPTTTAATLKSGAGGGANVGAGRVVLLPEDYEGSDQVIDLRLRL